MADTGWISLSNITSDNSLGGSVAWSNISRISASDNSRAVGNMLLPSSQMYAVWGYGMSFGVPSGATIDGIEVGMEGFRSNSFPTYGSSTATIWLGRSSTTMVGSSYTINFNNIAETVYTVGSSSDLWMDMGWTDSNINDLYLVFQVVSDGSAATLNLDHVKVKVYYTPSTLYTVSVSPVVATFSSPSVSASYVYALSASISPVSGVLSAVGASATYQIAVAASVSSLTAVWSASSVTASHAIEVSASVSPVMASWVVPSVSPSFETSLFASVSPVSCSWSIPGVTAGYASELSAAVSPVTSSFSAPPITTSYVLEATASVSPVSASFSMSVVQPVATVAFLLLWKDDGKSVVVTSVEDFFTVVNVMKDEAGVGNLLTKFATVVDTMTDKAEVCDKLDGYSVVGVARR